METTVYVEEEKVALIADPEVWQAKVKELGLEAKRLEYGSLTVRRPTRFFGWIPTWFRVFETLCGDQKTHREVRP